MLGMAVDCGKPADKRQLASDLRRCAGAAVDLNLWIDGNQLAMTLNQVARQLEQSADRDSKRF